MVLKKRIVFLANVICLGLICITTAFSKTDNSEEALRGRRSPGEGYVTELANDQAWELRKSAIGPNGTSYNLQKWTNEGPNGIGRVWDLQLDPRNDNHLYVGAGTGSGLWKTEDGGNTFECLSQEWKSQSIGDIEIDPSNPDIVWVGGGECIAGGGSIAYPGVGIMRSADAGDTWEHKGLDSSFFISMVKVHPTNSNIVFAGVMGNLFSPNPQRGIYRTTDGGTTWENVLYVNDSTGCIDLMIYTTNPDRIIAAMWTCMRAPYYRNYSGPESQVYKSEDGGETWTKMSGFLSTMGRINMDMCRDDPDIMYINVLQSSSEQGRMYKSTNGGTSFSATAGQPNGNFAYYGFAFNRVSVNPKDPDEAMLMGITIDRTTNGSSWGAAKFPSSCHVDFHAVQWGNQNNSIVYVGHDGGLSKCTGGIGSSLTTLGRATLANGGLSMAQIYGGDVASNDENYRIAGLQDNGTISTTNGAQYSWSSRVGGDGFHCKISPFNNNIGLGSLQHGVFYMTTNKTSWNQISIGGRKQWDCPVAFDPVTGRGYCGSQYVWSATNGNPNFSQIATMDMTNGNHTMSGSPYIMGSLVSLAAYDGTCYSGSDDGNVWYSKNATGTSASWKQIRDGDNPSGTNERTKFDGWITDLYIDESDATGATCYVSVWYHRWGLTYYKPCIYKLTNWGDGGVGSADWKDVTGDLPGFITTHKIVKDNNTGPTNGFLYCATDYGMFYSQNEGVNWKWMGGAEMPVMTIKDISMRAPGKVFAFSYGRGVFRMDLSTASIDNNQIDLSTKGNQIISNYPNPIVNQTTIRFRVKDNQRVSLGIYDLSGRLIKMVYNNNVHANKLNTVSWDVTSTNGAKIAAGNYICRLIGEKVTLARMITVKK